MQVDPKDGANLDSFFYQIGFFKELNQIHPLKCQYVKRYETTTSVKPL
jgi:hypothetical protein